MPASIALRNYDNPSAIRWLAKICHCLKEDNWQPEFPVIYDGADFRGDSQREANRALLNAVGRNGKVETLTLKNLNASEEELNLLADALTSNTRLHTLTLCNVFEGKADSDLLNTLFEATQNLTTLSLSRCKVSSKVGVTLGRMIHSGSLKSLKLNKVDLGDSATEFFKSISVDGLSSLEIRNTHADQQSFSNLFEYQKQNSVLQTFVGARCGLGSEAAKGLSEFLATSKSIMSVNISENEMNSESIKLLTQGLRINTSLEKLILSHNPIGDDGADAIAECLCQNQTLKSLYLLDCEVWGPGCIAFGNKLRDMQGLKNLYVDSDFEDHVDVILESMYSNMSLTRLSTDNVLVHDDPKWDQVEFFLKLNRAKRRILVAGDVPVSLWPKVLANCSGDASILFYLLRHKPEIATMM